MCACALAANLAIPLGCIEGKLGDSMKNAFHFALGLLLLAMAPLAHAVIVDEVAAVVDDEVILRSDLIRDIGPALNGLRGTTTSETEFNAQAESLLEDALEKAIEGKILYKEALLMGAQIDDKAIDEKIEEIQGQYDSYDAFLKALEDSGETVADFRVNVRKQIIAVSMAIGKRRQFEQEAVITETDMRQYYQDNSAEFNRPERAQVRRIFLTAEKDKASRAEVAARLEALREEVKQGANFGDLAKAHSEGPNKDEGGSLGWVKRGDLVAELENAVFGVQPGEMTAIVETEYGLHLMLVEAHEEAGSASYEEVRNEIEPKLRYKYAEELYRKWMSDLRAHSRVQTFI